MRSLHSEFWQEIIRWEIHYLVKELDGAPDVLSVGCGPAIIEGELGKHGHHVTGLDVSQEVLNRAPDGVGKILASAGKMPFAESSFDAVIYVASLQFIADYLQAIKEAVRVLRPAGRIIVMLLNPESAFFKDRFSNPSSYISGITHTDLKAMEDKVAESFTIRTEYCLGVKHDRIFESNNATEASLYIIVGTRRAST